MSGPQSDIDRARELHRGGAINDAKRIYESILEAEPANAEALHLLGVVGLQTGSPDRAIDLISQAIEIDEADARFHNNLGEAFRTRRDIPKALASYRAARALDPSFAQAINNEGAALMALGQVAEADNASGMPYRKMRPMCKLTLILQLHCKRLAIRPALSLPLPRLADSIRPT